MELIRWRPGREMMNFDRVFGNIFEDSFPWRTGTAQLPTETWSPKVDVYDNKDSFMIKAELPGIAKKDIKVNVDGRLLTLSGERKEEKSEDENSCHRREIFYGKFERTFTLPDLVDATKIKAEYKHGVLSLEVPKPEEHKPKEISIH